MSKIISVFVSHSWDNIKDLDDLRRLLENRGYFKVEFMQVEPSNPINSDNSTYIKSVLRRNIQNSNVVVGLGGMYASYSAWMEWELKTAREEGKKIVGVIPWGQERVSKVVSQYSNEIVRWNTESIVEAIRRNSDI